MVHNCPNVEKITFGRAFSKEEINSLDIKRHELPAAVCRRNYRSKVRFSGSYLRAEGCTALLQGGKLIPMAVGILESWRNVQLLERVNHTSPSLGTKALFPSARTGALATVGDSAGTMRIDTSNRDTLVFPAAWAKSPHRPHRDKRSWQLMSSKGR